jgi:hypothetical protein
MTQSPTLLAAVAHHRAGRLADADGGYRRALAEAPDSFAAWWNSAMIRSQTGAAIQTVLLIRRSLTADPDRKRALSGMAEQLVRQNSWLGLFGILAEWIRAEPGNPEPERMAAAAAAHLPDAAVPATLLRLAAADRHGGRRGHAAALCRVIAALAPDNENVLAEVAVLAAMLGDLKLAIDCSSRVLAVRPDHAAASNTLAQTRQALAAGLPERGLWLPIASGELHGVRPEAIRSVGSASTFEARCPQFLFAQDRERFLVHPDTEGFRTESLVAAMVDGRPTFTYAATDGYCADVADARVDLPDGRVFSRDGRFFTDTGSLWQLQHSRRFRRTAGNADWSAGDYCFAWPPQRLPGAYRLLCGEAIHNFAHWLIFVSTKIAAFQRDPTSRGAKFVLPEAALSLPDVGATLAAAGIDADDVLYLPPGTYDADCAHHASYLHSGGYGPAAVDWLRSTFMKGEAARRTGPGRRGIYISRRDTRLRQVANEDVLVEALEKRGFISIVPGTLSIAEKAELFSDAHTVIGIHGAGMAASMLLPMGARVIELFSPNYMNTCFIEAVLPLQIEHYAVVGTPDGSYDPTREWTKVYEGVSAPVEAILDLVDG